MENLTGVSSFLLLLWHILKILYIQQLLNGHHVCHYHTFSFSRIHYNTHLISMHNGPPECNSPTCLNDFMTNLSIYLHFYPHFFLSRIYYYYSNSIGEKSVSLGMTFFCHFQGSLHEYCSLYITYGNIIYSAQLW